MNIVITGSSGFVGSLLIDALIEKGHDVTAVDMAPLPQKIEIKVLRSILADTTKPGDWQDEIHNADAVINLTGKNIFRPWTKKIKKMIYDSRILTTRHVVDAISDSKPVSLVSTSAAGYYGDRGDEVLDESKGAGDDFLARVCVDWEKEAFKARKKNARVVCARFGVVLGPNGGALSKMIPAYRMLVGGPLGSGQQWFAWIQIEDLVNAIRFVIDNDDIEGPVNLCSPNPVRNNEFSKTLANVLNRPAFFRVPAFMLRLVAGELGDLVLNSQRAVPNRLASSGYSFKYPGLSEALEASVG